MYVESFKDLIVWQRSMELVIEIYTYTKTLPKSELFGLVSQMQRAAVAIPSNIAEGKKRKTIKDYCQFLRIADGSAAELETQLLLSKKIYPNDKLTQVFQILGEVQRMLTTIIAKLERKLPTS